MTKSRCPAETKEPRSTIMCRAENMRLRQALAFEAQAVKNNMRKPDIFHLRVQLSIERMRATAVDGHHPREDLSYFTRPLGRLFDHAGRGEELDMKFQWSTPVAGDPADTPRVQNLVLRAALAYEAVLAEMQATTEQPDMADGRRASLVASVARMRHSALTGQHEFSWLEMFAEPLDNLPGSPADVYVELWKDAAGAADPDSRFDRLFLRRAAAGTKR